MAIYEYYCPTCRNRFEQRRSMSEATVAVKCEKGHDAERALSAFAVKRSGGIDMEEMSAGMGGGGCCGGGGGCACSN
jgi:putative FmdB family regulatory protein